MATTGSDSPAGPDSPAAPDAGGSIFTRPVRGSRGPQPEYSRTAIAAAAMRLADAGGLGAVTMRAVAAELGTGAGSLYRYLSSRDDLIDLMLDAAAAEVPLGAPSRGDWVDDLVALAHAQLDAYRRHPWMVEALQRPATPGPHTVDFFEECLRIMSPLRAGTSAKMEAIAVMTGTVSLFARAPSPPDAPSPEGSSAPSPPNPFAGLDSARHPHLMAALAAAAPGPPRDDLFDRVLRSVLTGLLT